MKQCTPSSSLPLPPPVNILNNVTGNSRWPTIPPPDFTRNRIISREQLKSVSRSAGISSPHNFTPGSKLPCFLALLQKTKKKKEKSATNHAETGFLPQLFHRSIPQFFGTVQFLVLSYLASLIIYRGNAWCFSPACKRNRIPRSKEEPIHRVNKRRRGVASEEAG